MKKKFEYSERRGLPGGPNETFSYTTGVFSTEGYKRYSPDVNNPFNIIPSGNITMKDVDFPVEGTDNLGNSIMMEPGYDYKFPGNMVFERPIKEEKAVKPYGSVNTFGNMAVAAGGLKSKNLDIEAKYAKLLEQLGESTGSFNLGVNAKANKNNYQFNINPNITLSGDKPRIGINAGIKKTFRKGGGLLTKNMKCNNCGWSWRGVDGGKDATTCHKCGGSVLPKAQSGREQSKGETRRTAPTYITPEMTVQAFPNATPAQREALSTGPGNPMYRNAKSQLMNNKKPGNFANETADAFSYLVAGAPMEGLQTPQSLLVEGIEAARGNDYNFKNALPGYVSGATNEQRFPSQTFLQNAPFPLQVAGDILIDPFAIEGAAKGGINAARYVKNFPKAFALNLDDVGTKAFKPVLNTKQLSGSTKAASSIDNVGSGFKSEIDWGKEYFQKMREKEDELLKLYNKEKITWPELLTKNQEYEKELTKGLGLMESLGRGAYGTVFPIANEPSKVIKLGMPMSSGQAMASKWTPELIENLKSINQNANIAIPEKVKYYEVPVSYPPTKEVMTMPNLNQVVAKKLNLNKRDRYAYFLKQARQLRDKGISLDVDNSSNFKFNPEKGVFDIYDINPANFMNPSYYMHYVRDNTKRKLLDNMLYRNGGSLPKAQDGLGLSNLYNKAKNLITESEELDYAKRLVNTLPQYLNPKTYSYSSEEGLDSIPNYNKYNNFGEAFKQAREDLGRGQTFLYDGIRHTTNKENEFPNDESETVFNTMTKTLSPEQKNKAKEYYFKQGAPYLSLEADDTKFSILPNAQVSFSDLSDRAHVNPVGPYNKVYLETMDYDLLPDEISEYEKSTGKTFYNQDVNLLIDELAHIEQVRDKGTGPFFKHFLSDAAKGELQKKSPYDMEGAIEHSAHDVIGPKRLKEIMGYQTGGQLPRAQIGKEVNNFKDFVITNEELNFLNSNKEEYCPKGNCLESTKKAFNLTAGKIKGVPDMYNVFENDLKVTSAKGKPTEKMIESNPWFAGDVNVSSSDSWDVQGNILNSEGQIVYNRNNPESVYYPGKAAIGSIYSFGPKGEKYSEFENRNQGYNTKFGLQPSHHSVSVVGFNKESNENVLYDSYLNKYLTESELIKELDEKRSYELETIGTPKSYINFTKENLESSDNFYNPNIMFPYKVDVNNLKKLTKDPAVKYTYIEDEKEKYRQPDFNSDAMKGFVTSLEDNKEVIMGATGISNEKYDRLADLAIAIAMAETEGGAELSFDWLGKTQGLTQLNYDNIKDDEVLQKTIDKINDKVSVTNKINSISDLRTPSKSAIATIAYLSKFEDKAKNLLEKGEMPSERTFYDNMGFKDNFRYSSAKINKDGFYVDAIDERIPFDKIEGWKEKDINKVTRYLNELTSTNDYNAILDDNGKIAITMKTKGNKMDMPYGKTMAYFWQSPNTLATGDAQGKSVYASRVSHYYDKIQDLKKNSKNSDLKYQTGGEYTVQAGNTFDGIANLKEVPKDLLRKANPDIDYNNIKVGQVINIPDALKTKEERMEFSSGRKREDLTENILSANKLENYLAESRGNTPEFWKATADTIAYHESGPWQRMDPKAIQRSQDKGTGEIFQGPGEGLFQIETDRAGGSNSFSTFKNRYVNIAEALGMDADPEIMNAKRPIDLPAEKQYTLFYSNLIESPDVKLKDYVDGKLSLEDLWLKGHKIKEAKGDRENFQESVQNARKKGIPFTQIGEETSDLEIYKNYINGLYDGTEMEAAAQRLYDKLNRVYYGKAKGLEMSVPNYIMTNIINRTN